VNEIFIFQSFNVISTNVIDIVYTCYCLRTVKQAPFEDFTKISRSSEHAQSHDLVTYQLCTPFFIAHAQSICRFGFKPGLVSYIGFHATPSKHPPYWKTFACSVNNSDFRLSIHLTAL
jgi:hypothetical protein